MECYNQFWWNWWVNVIIAAATVSAVLLALFGDIIKARLFHPKLALRLKNSTGEKTKVFYKTKSSDGRDIQTEEDARYYHLILSNNARWSKSNNTQVFLQKLEETDPDKKFQTKWDGEVPMEWLHHSLYPITRTVGSEIHCDLCSVGQNKWIRLHPVLAPATLKYIYQTKVNLRLTLQAKGDEGDSQKIKISIAWDGFWDGDETEMAKHLIIKNVTNE